MEETFLYWKLFSHLKNAQGAKGKIQVSSAYEREECFIGLFWWIDEKDVF